MKGIRLLLTICLYQPILLGAEGQLRQTTLHQCLVRIIWVWHSEEHTQLECTPLNGLYTSHSPILTSIPISLPLFLCFLFCYFVLI